MDLIDVECTEWRELFDVDSHEKIVRDRIAGAFQEGLESVQLDTLRIPAVQDEVLLFIRV